MGIIHQESECNNICDNDHDCKEDLDENKIIKHSESDYDYKQEPDENNKEQWVKSIMFKLHQQFIHHSESKKQFELAISHIITYNQTQNVFNLLSALRNVSRKLSQTDIKY